MTVWQPHGTRLDQQVAVGSQGCVRNADYFEHDGDEDNTLAVQLRPNQA